MNNDIKSIMKNCALFASIEREKIDILLKCLSAKRQNYMKEEFVFLTEEPARYVGVVLVGGVNVIQEDYWGNRTILTHINAGELFGEAFSCAEIKKLPVSVIATDVSEILLIDYKKIVTVCSSSCGFHTQLISNMLRILANKNIMLTRKMGYISKRTTREKLLSFLSAQAIQFKSNVVVIPYNRQELADFLCVDRSALSREIALMKKDGLLEYEKNRFVLK